MSKCYMLLEPVQVGDVQVLYVAGAGTGWRCPSVKCCRSRYWLEMSKCYMLLEPVLVGDVQDVLVLYVV